MEIIQDTYESLNRQEVPKEHLISALKVQSDEIDSDEKARAKIQQAAREGVIEPDGDNYRLVEASADGGQLAQAYEDAPQMLKDRDIWLMWDSSADTPRRPHWRGNFGISWSDPDDWHSFEEAVEAASEKESWGIGYVNAYDNDDHPEGVMVTLDLDGCLDDEGHLKDWVPELDVFGDCYVEVSPSGNGLHIPVIGYDAPDWWSDQHFSDDEHEGVEVLTNKFCTLTGEKFFGSGDEPAEPARDIDGWLEQAYAEITGQAPQVKTTDLQQYSGETELSDEQIQKALDHIDPDCSYGEWRDIGYALVNHYGAGSKAERVFDNWSRGGSKYREGKTKHYIKNITHESDPDGGVTVATLIHRAKQNGWQPDFGREGANGQAKPDPSEEHDDPDEKDDKCAKFTRDCVIRRAGYDPDEKAIDDLTNGDIALGIERIVRDHDDQHYRVMRDKTEAIYAYDNGVWTENGEIHIKRLMRRATPNKNTRQLHRETCHQLRSDYNLMMERDDLGAPAGTIATQDGLVDLLDCHVRELEPEDFALNKIDSGYSPEAECPTFKDFVRDSCSAEDLEKLQEYAGYLLWQHAQPIGKACFLVGPTDSGKGTFIKAMKTVLGKDNVSAQSLDDLVSTRWGPAHMFGKIANMRNEVKPEGVENIEMFKEITGGGDEITAEFKGEQKFEYTVTQKQLFSTNQFPIPDHADEAFWNRCVFVEFPVTVPDEEKDLQLLSKIRKEREGVLNWMIEGLRRLMESGRFSGERDIKEKQEIAASYGSPVQRFKFNALRISGNSKDVVDRSDLHDVYAAFAKRELDRAEDDILGQAALTKKLKKDDRIDKTRSRSLSSGRERDDAMSGIQIKKPVLEHLNMVDDVNQNSAAEQKGDGQTGL